MPRTKRHWVSQEAGSFHIISRVAGGELLFNDGDKEYFLKLLERFAAGFFIEIHAFCVMSNHFHILATGMEKEAGDASKEELFRRYHAIFGDDAEPPAGKYDSCYQLIPDADDGEQRLRCRLGSISRFVQEVKQTFSRWYNKRYERFGYLWGERYKGVIVSKGEAQLACSAYIDLNPVRAAMVQKPEDYRWSSLGLRVRSSQIEPKNSCGPFLYCLVLMIPIEMTPTRNRRLFPTFSARTSMTMFPLTGNSFINPVVLSVAAVPVFGRRLPLRWRHIMGSLV